MDESRITIREFKNNDRQAVRQISCETAFIGAARGQFFNDDEVLADALTLYYTDYEPESCFVAADREKVLGYIIGSTDVKKMNKIFARKVLPHLISKSLSRAVLFKITNLRFLSRVFFSLLKGEFFVPDFCKAYPATLHINIQKDYRGQKLGRRLMESYLAYIQRVKVRGVHLGTTSEQAKNFFIKCGFAILYQGRRSYLRYVLRQDMPYYILGKLL
jgi:GNAT superfamily N-acetyltransferase